MWGVWGVMHTVGKRGGKFRLLLRLQSAYKYSINSCWLHNGAAVLRFMYSAAGV